MTVVYLLHFTSPIGNPKSRHGQAQHYIGSTDDLDQRLERHRQGRSGSGIVRAFHQAGIEFELARIWEGDRGLERKIKNRKEAPRLCPICQEMFGKRDKQEMRSNDHAAHL